MVELEKKMKELNDLIIDIEKTIESTFDKTSQIDLEVSDILHNIELTTDKNVVGGYQEYAFLKEKLKKRRVVKTENKQALHLKQKDFIKNINSFKRTYIEYRKYVNREKQHNSCYHVRLLTHKYGEKIKSEVGYEN